MENNSPALKTGETPTKVGDLMVEAGESRTPRIIIDPSKNNSAVDSCKNLNPELTILIPQLLKLLTDLGQIAQELNKLLENSGQLSEIAIFLIKQLFPTNHQHASPLSDSIPHIISKEQDK